MALLLDAVEALQKGGGRLDRYVQGYSGSRSGKALGMKQIKPRANVVVEGAAPAKRKKSLLEKIQTAGPRNPDGSLKGFGGLRKLNDALGEFYQPAADAGDAFGKSVRMKIKALQAAITKELKKKDR